MDLKILVLSALLHDIGKFAQRAKRPYSKTLQGEYLPVFDGKYSHWHALYSDYFIENDLPLPGELEEFRSQIARTASTHHRPVENNLMDMCVSIADRLSSGADRIHSTDEESKAGFRESRLISIFDEIELLNHQFEPPGKYFYKLVPLDIKDDVVFPVKDAATGPAKEYQVLFDQFHNELGKINIKNGFTPFMENLISLLERFTWAIPSSSYKTISDIPLFDHSFSTAGIAQALFLYHKETGTVPSFSDDEKKFILVSGDLSGIQKYIFGISHSTSRGVSKIFRARSFFIQAVVQSAILEIENRFNIHSVCRLMNSGGKFILLLPNIDSVKQELEKIDHEIQVWFRQKFKGTLTLPLAWSTDMSQQDFEMNRFTIKLDEANEALGTAKLQKLHKTFKNYGNVIDHDYEEFEGGNCALCERNASDEKASEIYSSKEKNDLPVCRDCADQITYIGKNLPNSKYLVYSREGKIPLFGQVYLSIENKKLFNFNDCFRVETLINEPGYVRARIARHLPSISTEELKNQALFSLFEKEEGFHDMIRPLENNSDSFVPKTFSMIADKSRKQLGDGKLTGRPLLGFLKADVDNLGLIFSTGLSKNISMARIASLSRMINFFFTDYIVSLLENDFPDIYVVFSGGDDLFLIGPWNQTINFALKMRSKFSEFCAMNPDITLSCGILTTKSRLPVRKAVYIAEEYLEKAKNVKSGKRVKDSVCFLETPLSWKEFENLMRLGKKFDKALEEKDRTLFSNSFLYRLLTYHKMYLNFAGKGDIKSGRYLSHAHYDIGRNIFRKDEKNKDELTMLYDIFSIGTDKSGWLEHLDIPIFYAMNLNRKF